MQQAIDFNESATRAGIRSILGTAGIVMVAVVVALLSTGGSYALWADSATVAGSTVTTGSMKLTVDGKPEITLANSSWTDLLPGESAFYSFDVANEGDAMASVSATAALLEDPNLLSDNLALKLGIVASDEQCVAGFVGHQGALENFATPPTELSADQSIVACLQITLNPGAPIDAQGMTVGIRLHLDSTQVSS